MAEARPGRPRRYDLEPLPGFAHPFVGHAVAALDELSERLFDLISDLPPEALAFVPEGATNAIAMLVIHMAWAEASWIARATGRAIPDELASLLQPGRQDASGELPPLQDLTGRSQTCQVLLIALCRRVRQEVTVPALAPLVDVDAEMIANARVRHPQRPMTVRGVLMHLIWHWTYHSGQVGLLRRLWGARYRWTFACNQGLPSKSQIARGCTLLTPTLSFSKSLGDGLALKSVAGERDVERVAALNRAIHGEGVAAMAGELLLHHPHTRPEHWLFVEDEGSGQVVSSLCLIPWTWQYEGVTLRAGEMGLVGTLEAYRHRGLVRAQAARHAELLEEGGYDLSHIQGIPYFYRQFGYEYAIPLAGGWRVDLHLIPSTGERVRSPLRAGPDPQPPNHLTAQPPNYSFRRATLDDLPALMRLYDEAANDLSIHTVRDEAEWRYLLGPSTRTEMVAETWMVMGRGKRGKGEKGKEGVRMVGYFRVPAHGFGEGLIVNEVSRLSGDAALAVLGQLKALSVERNKPYIRLDLPANSTLVQVARYRDAHDLGYYAWQIRLIDVARLLRKLAPALERRLAASPLAGLTRDVCLNLYREAFEMRFVEGRLAAVETLGGELVRLADRGGIRLPPPLLAPLLLGYRSREELCAAHHDVSVSGDLQHLVDVLFPKVQSFIYTVY